MLRSKAIVEPKSEPQKIDFWGRTTVHIRGAYFHAFETNGQIGHTCVGPQKLRWPRAPQYLNPSLTMITTFMGQFSKSCKLVTDDRQCRSVANSYTAPLEKVFKIDANGASAFMGHVLCGVETVKHFVNVYLHCNANNLKKISKMSPLTPSEKFLQTSVVTFTLWASFHVWAN